MLAVKKFLMHKVQSYKEACIAHPVRISLFWLSLLIGILARTFMFGEVPGDINQDEAFAGYNAYTLLHYARDSYGYRLPVYLTAWGSGMNALESYLMIPFVALFGLKIWAIRLPMLLVGIFSLVAVYKIVLRFSNTKFALLALFLVAISPWHVMLSRWALECRSVYHCGMYPLRNLDACALFESLRLDFTWHFNCSRMPARSFPFSQQGRN